MSPLPYRTTHKGWCWVNLPLAPCFFGQAYFIHTKANVVALLPAEGHYFADDRARHLFLET